MSTIETMSVEQLKEFLLSLHPEKGSNQIQEILARLNYLEPIESDVDAAWQDFKERIRETNV